MVDQVEITNVGTSGGVASEVTLKRLNETLAEMAKKQGLDLKNAQTGSNKLADALGEGKSATNKFSSALGKASRRLANFGVKALGAVSNSAIGLATELASSSNNLSDFAQHIPIAGRHLARLTGIIDVSFNSFQSIATSGAAFSYDLGELRSQVASSGLSMQEYSQFVRDSSQAMAGFGGTVERGARRTQRMMDALGEQRVELQALGLTQEDLNESLVHYQHLTRVGAQTEQRSIQQQADSAAALSKNMLTLAKLTGKDVKAQQEALAVEQQDMAVQQKLSRMTAEERVAFNKELGALQAQFGEDSGAVQAFKAEFLGMPPITKDAQMFTATMGDAANQVTSLARGLREGTFDLEELDASMPARMAKRAGAAIDAAEQFSGVLAAEAAGMEGLGIGKNFDQLTQHAIQFMEDGRYDYEAATEAFRKAYSDTAGGSGDEVQAMAQFRDALRNARQELTDSLVNPMLNQLNPAILKGTTALNDFTKSDAFDGFLEKIKDSIETFGNWFGEWLGKFKEDPQEALRELFDDHIGPFFNKAIEKVIGLIGDGIKGGIKDMFTSPGVLAAMTAGIAGLFAVKGMGSGGAGGGGGRGRGRLGRMLRAGGPLGLAGLAAGAVGSKATDAGYEKTGTALDIGGSALTGAGLGAAIGSVVPVIGTAVGGAVGGVLGTGYGLFKNFRSSDEADGASEQARIESLEQSKMQDLATAQAASMVTDAQIERLEKMTGFAPKVKDAARAINGFESTFNKIDLNYREIDKATDSFEKMADQLEEINNQLKGDRGVLDKMNPFSRSNETPTAGEFLSGAGSDRNEKLEDVNRTLVDILGVLMRTHDIDRRQLNATRAMTNNLYAGS